MLISPPTLFNRPLQTKAQSVFEAWHAPFPTPRTAKRGQRFKAKNGSFFQRKKNGPFRLACPDSIKGGDLGFESIGRPEKRSIVARSRKRLTFAELCRSRRRRNCARVNPQPIQRLASRGRNSFVCLLLDDPNHLVQTNFPWVVDRKSGFAPANAGSNSNSS